VSPGKRKSASCAGKPASEKAEGGQTSASNDNPVAHYVNVHVVNNTWAEYDADWDFLTGKNGSQKIGVFFSRTGLDDPDGGDPGNANWFNHYAVDHMGAVDHMLTSGQFRHRARC